MTESQDTAMTEPTTNEPEESVEVDYGVELKGSIFPYVDNKKHWDIDYNDTSQSYEGSALPAWILAGFAVFVLWAIVYLLVAT